MDSVLSSTVQDLYNDRELSDIKVIVNNEEHYVMSRFVKTVAPKLWDNVETIRSASSPSAPHSLFQVSDLSPEEAVKRIANVISQQTQKKYTIVSYTMPCISNNSVTVVLESLYGKPVMFSLENLDEIHQLSTIFGMHSLLAQCIKFLQEQIDGFKTALIPTAFVNAWKKAIKEKSPLLSQYHNAIMQNLFRQPRDHILVIVLNFEFDILQEFLKSETLICGEDVIYEIVKNWIAANLVTSQQIADLYSMVKLELLSVDYLITKVKPNPEGPSYAAYVKALEESATRCIGYRQKNAIRGANLSNIIFRWGKHQATYLGYHQVTKEEVGTEAFRQLLKEQYLKNNGFASLDNFTAFQLYCSSGEQLGLSESRPLRFDTFNSGPAYGSLQQDVIQSIRVTNNSGAFTRDNMEKICLFPQHTPCSGQDAGLFIADGVIF